MAEQGNEVEIRPLDNGGQEILLNGERVSEVCSYEIKCEAPRNVIEISLKLRVARLRFSGHADVSLATV